MKHSILLFSLLLSISAKAQTILGEMKLPTVDENGFYRIAIAPENAKYFTHGFANLRVKDGTGGIVPYITDADQDKMRDDYLQYTILENTRKEGCCTNLILENDRDGAIGNLHLQIKNAEATKKASLLGSDDKLQWFVLKEHFTISTVNNSSGTSEIRIVDFPLSNYRYYRLQIDDSSSAALNILSAGYYKMSLNQGKYESIPGVKLIHTDSARSKQSFVRIILDTAHWVDRVAIRADGAPFFHREAGLYEVRRVVRKGRLTEDHRLLISFSLENDKDQVINLPGKKISELLLMIHNRDNPPLQITEVKLSQLARSLVAYLEKDKQYKIEIGIPEMELPDYDLSFFRNKIPVDIPVIIPNSVNITADSARAGTPTFFTREIMWFAIIMIIGVLGLFTYRMVKDHRVSGHTDQ